MICSPFGKGIFWVYLNHELRSEPWLMERSWAVDFDSATEVGWDVERVKEAIRFNLMLSDGREASILYDQGNGTLSYLMDAEPVLTQVSHPQIKRNWLIVKKQLSRPGEVRVFGLGENTPPMNKAGQTIVMWNMAPLMYKMGTTPLYQSYPVVICQYVDGPAFGLVFDNPCYSVFKFSEDGKKISYYVRDLELNYFILLGSTLPEVMEQLTSLTGRLVPLPKWSLGYQQSRWSYAPSARVREIAASFRDRDIPCDAIYLDIDYMEHYKSFTWGEGFKDYRELINDLHAGGFKVITIVNPGLKLEPGYKPYDSGLSKGVFLVNRDGGYVTRSVWPGPSLFPDFLDPSVQKWWGEMISEFVRPGVDGIWCDMNEPSTFDLRRTLPCDAIQKLSGAEMLFHEKVHNLYGMLMTKATYEGLLKVIRLPYILTRSSYLGGQRYAVAWTGDNYSSWEHLRAGIPMILNLGLSGQPVAGPDIGGYYGEPTPELYERWILQGAFFPFSRTHTRRNTKDQEPWSFGEQVEISARKAIKLRYQMLPYFYSLLYGATQNGQLIMRPIFYHTPTESALNPEFYETEFLIGPYLLLAPLMDTAPTRMFYLPPGVWYSWWNGNKIEGDRVFQTNASEDANLPLFVRENAIVPLYPEPPSFIPDHSLKTLEIMVPLTGVAQGEVVEYFDREALLAYDVVFTLQGNQIKGKITKKTKGRVPSEYRPPEILKILVNHSIQNVRFSTAVREFSIQPDSGRKSWTLVTVNDATLPLEFKLW